MTAMLEATAFGGRVLGSAAEFDAAFDHVVSLLHDAVSLFCGGSHAIAAFLAITALEETSKVHVGVTRQAPGHPSRRGRDPLRDHRSKHHIAILPTVFMSSRIVEALGAEACERLHTEAQSEGFTATREAAIYFRPTEHGFVVPQDAVSQQRAWELLILAIEAADDGLAGYTNHSLVDRRLHALFERMMSARTG
jgi:AbiV family abortive infection protein